MSLINQLDLIAMLDIEKVFVSYFESDNLFYFGLIANNKFLFLPL
jgi:hypothetical protein